MLFCGKAQENLQPTTTATLESLHQTSNVLNSHRQTSTTLQLSSLNLNYVQQLSLGNVFLAHQPAFQAFLLH